MKLVLVCCQSANESWSREAEQLYVKKISPFFPFEVLHLETRKTAREDGEKKRKSDSDAILQVLKETDEVVLFDERGKHFDSRNFSKDLERKLASGKKRIVFVIGGAYGVDERIRSIAKTHVAMSAFVLNHLVAQTVALEQIYRGLCIYNNIPYHND